MFVKICTNVPQNESTLGFLDNLEKSFVKENWSQMIRLGFCYNIIVSKPHGVPKNGLKMTTCKYASMHIYVSI